MVASLQIKLERWGTARVIRKTLFNGKQFVARQATLLKQFAFNNKPKQQFFNRSRLAWLAHLKNADLIRGYQRFWRFQTARANHGRRQLTMAESLAMSRARAAMEAEAEADTEPRPPWTDIE